MNTTCPPAGPRYLRQLPAALAGINLQYGLTSHRAEQIKTLEIEDGRVELRAATGPDYGRIYDHELVEAVQRIAGNGTGDTRWKVPGVLDWPSRSTEVIPMPEIVIATAYQRDELSEAIEHTILSHLTRPSLLTNTPLPRLAIGSADLPSGFSHTVIGGRPRGLDELAIEGDQALAMGGLA